MTKYNRAQELQLDLAKTFYIYKKLKSKSAKSAINQLRYLLIINKHRVEIGSEDVRYR